MAFIKKSTPSPRKIEKNKLFDYSTKENREATINWLYEYSKQARGQREQDWIKYDNYYNNIHDTQLELEKAMRERNVSWVPSVVPDAWIHVEGQIQPEMPVPEFNGRDDDLDSQKAKQREYVVKYILEKNDVPATVTRNERRLLKYGDCFFKVYYDGTDIVVTDIPVESIFPDPAAKSLDECEYVNYTYRLHKRKAARIFANELKKQGKTIEDYGADDYQENRIFETSSDFYSVDDTVQVLEHWYKDDDGDVCCSTLLNLIEIKNIEKYWRNTGKQNKLFPFTHIWRIGNENDFWNKSELEPIIELIDDADRELAYGIMNDAFMANDIVISESGTFEDDTEPDNAPGSHWHVKSGQINSVKRLGGLANSVNRLPFIEKLQNEIERTVGNYDSAMGKEPERVNSASGIALLNERADSRKSIKAADRYNGYKKLFELIDWTALEFYDDNRMIFIGAENKDMVLPDGVENINPKLGPVIFHFNSDNMRSATPEVMDENGKIIKEAEYYYPRVDVTVNTGDGKRQSKAFTISVLQQLSQTGITAENYKLIIMFVDLLDIPQRKEIIDDIKQQFEGNIPTETPTQQSSADKIIASLSPEDQQYVQQNPQILQEVGINAGT